MTVSLNRRQLIQMYSLGLLSAGWPSLAAPLSEETLTEAMRMLLRQRLAGQTPVPQATEQTRRWQSFIDIRLTPWMPDQALRQEFVQHLGYEAPRAGMSLSLMLALVEVESGFRKHAISSAGAMGYAQVMPFWTRWIGDGDASMLWNTQTNLRYACLILRHYLDLEKGDLGMALGRYNGSRGLPHYPERVLQARAKWRTEID
jgi:soluble lytic murein transglycosylase-like protein